ncbi:hypothetical protein XFF4834R_chr25510 [Xanthomonas citri pv. fuscans]|nr:hypothetical protein XFF4834R_chr25510 [Xanthomonas citri pv. fuscans]
MVRRRRSALAGYDRSASAYRPRVPCERVLGVSVALTRLTPHGQERFRIRAAGAPALPGGLPHRPWCVSAAAIAVSGAAIAHQCHVVFSNLP